MILFSQMKDGDVLVVVDRFQACMGPGGKCFEITRSGDSHTLTQFD